MMSSSASANASLVPSSVSQRFATMRGSGSLSAAASLNSVAMRTAAAATSQASSGNIVSPWNSVGVIAPVVLAVGMFVGVTAM
jgi:hypothetical protein